MPGCNKRPAGPILLEKPAGPNTPGVVNPEVARAAAAVSRAGDGGIVKEWLKNLNHVSFGRIGSGPQHVPDRTHPSTLDEELDYVRRALANTMAHAYREIREIWRARTLPNLRTAAFVLAIDKVAAAYEAVGIFP